MGHGDRRPRRAQSPRVPGSYVAPDWRAAAPPPTVSIAQDRPDKVPTTRSSAARTIRDAENRDACGILQIVGCSRPPDPYFRTLNFALESVSCCPSKVKGTDDHPVCDFCPDSMFYWWARVFDQNGSLIADASVNTLIIKPDGTSLTSVSATIGADGWALFSVALHSGAATGAYQGQGLQHHEDRDVLRAGKECHPISARP
jgi:hypothetical protein